MTLSKILHILRTGEDIAPAFIDTAKAMLATLKGDDQQALQDAIDAARVRSDELHEEVQAEADKVINAGNDKANKQA